MNITTLRSLLVSALLLLTPPAASAGESGGYLKISELHYPDWITTAPSTLLPEFEQGCKAVAAHLHNQNLDFKSDDCVSNLFTAATFIALSNDFIDNNLSANTKGQEAMTKTREQYNRVISEVIDKTIRDGKASTQKDNANLIYTVIVTIAGDVLTSYYHNVLADDNEASVLMKLAEEENDRRLRRDGEYQEIYQRLSTK